jgi:hypothetical protein
MAREKDGERVLQVLIVIIQHSFVMLSEAKDYACVARALLSALARVKMDVGLLVWGRASRPSGGAQLRSCNGTSRSLDSAGCSQAHHPAPLGMTS